MVVAAFVSQWSPAEKSMRNFCRGPATLAHRKIIALQMFENSLVALLVSFVSVDSPRPPASCQRMKQRKAP